MVEATKYSLKPFFVSAVSVDIVIFGFEGKSLRVLLVQRGVEPFKDHWALPGEMVQAEENLDAAADRVLHELTSLTDVYLEQVASFGAPQRHPAGRAFTVAYYSLIGTSSHPVSPNGWAKNAQYFDVADLPDLAFDHTEVLQSCLERLRERVRMRPIGFELLPRTFSLSDLQNLYESILGETLDKRNFRKKILSMGIVEDTGDLQANVNHRPAKLYRFDEERYEALVKKGFSFAV
ncbi:MAG: NUDIX domain-containing protein [Saprospiraceae bacterium]